MNIEQLHYRDTNGKTAHCYKDKSGDNFCVLEPGTVAFGKSTSSFVWKQYYFEIIFRFKNTVS